MKTVRIEKVDNGYFLTWEKDFDWRENVEASFPQRTPKKTSGAEICSTKKKLLARLEKLID